MSVSRLDNLNSWAQKHIRLISGLLGCLIIASIFSLKFIKYNNDIESMLPSDSQVQQSMRFLRESNFSDKLVISLKLKDNRHTTQELLDATDRLVNAIDSPLVRQVIGNINSANFMQEMIFFLEYSAQLYSPEIFATLSQRTSPEGIKRELDSIWRKSLTPQSTFILPFAQSDPLNLNSEILGNIAKLSQASGYNVAIDRGHFVSQDGSAAMIIIKTSVLLTDGFGSRQIINYLREKLRALPEYISADIIAGHLHTIQNEDSIKKDIRVTTFIAALGFILLFLFIFRDYRAIIIFLMPLGAVLITTGISSLIFKNLSYFVIGLSSVVAGITIDYGVYVYMAVRKAGNSPETLKKIRKPMFFGALTTISIFIVFFFSSVSGYHQLAFFSNFTIILCLGFAQFILPYLIKQEKPRTKPVSPLQKEEKLNPGRLDYLFLFCWIALIAIMAFLATGLKFNNDITQFDGITKDVVRSETEFHRTWGNKELPAVFVVSAPTLQSAYDLNDAVYAKAQAAIGRENFTSFSSIWPGMLKRKENLEAWNRFWNEQKIKEFQKQLSEYGAIYNFSEDAFGPFIRKLQVKQALETEPKDLAIFEQLKEQFVLKKEGGYQILSFFPDKDAYVAKLTHIQEDYPGSFLVSRKNFSQQVSRALSSEFIILALLSVLLTLGLTVFLLKNLRLTILAITPILTSLIFMFGLIRLFGLYLNIPSLIAGMVVVGIVSDYGIFMVYYCKYQYQTGTVSAVSLCAATTLIGTGVLLFAQHPILFSIGVTLTSGILTGYLTSLLLIPALYRLWKEKQVV